MILQFEGMEKVFSVERIINFVFDSSLALPPSRDYKKASFIPSFQSLLLSVLKIHPNPTSMPTLLRSFSHSKWVGYKKESKEGKERGKVGGDRSKHIKRKGRRLFYPLRRMERGRKEREKDDDDA